MTSCLDISDAGAISIDAERIGLASLGVLAPYDDNHGAEFPRPAPQPTTKRPTTPPNINYSVMLQLTSGAISINDSTY